MKYILDAKCMQERKEAHAYLKKELNLPDYYGNNLDALYDCLTAVSGKVRLLEWETAESNLGIYGKKAKKVIATAALHNRDLDLYI